LGTTKGEKKKKKTPPKPPRKSQPVVRSYEGKGGRENTQRGLVKSASSRGRRTRETLRRRAEYYSTPPVQQRVPSKEQQKKGQLEKASSSAELYIPSAHSSHWSLRQRNANSDSGVSRWKTSGWANRRKKKGRRTEKLA